MKKIANVFLFLLLGNICFSLDIIGTEWGPEKGDHGYYLRFKTQNEFDFIYSGEGGGQIVVGTYTKNNDDITLFPGYIEGAEVLPSFIKQKTVKCSIVETNSLFSKYKLVGAGGLELWMVKNSPKNGDECMLDGLIVYAFSSKGKVNENARIRKGPGLQYQFYSFSFEDEPEIYNALPKGNSILILGYSENKTIIDGAEHPWYYCVFRKNMWEQQFCWIWGGLIDF